MSSQLQKIHVHMKFQLSRIRTYKRSNKSAESVPSYNTQIVIQRNSSVPEALQKVAPPPAHILCQELLQQAGRSWPHHLLLLVLRHSLATAPAPPLLETPPPTTAPPLWVPKTTPTTAAPSPISAPATIPASAAISTACESR